MMIIKKYSFLILLLIISCSKKNNFNEVSVKLPNYNHSKYHVNFKTDFSTSVKISYWKDQNEVLYFSRSLIPFSKFASSTTYLKHIGIYLYKKNFLRKFNKLKQSSLEKNENLEQLRILENGYKILAFRAKKETKGIFIR